MSALKEASSRKVPLEAEPVYEYHIEPTVYFVATVLCLTASLSVLWFLLQNSMDSHHLTTATVLWVLLGIATVISLRGVRYGATLKVYRGFIELGSLGPLQVYTSGEIASFQEFLPNTPLHRVYLHLRTGERVKLPRVNDPAKMCRTLQDWVGVARYF